MAAERNWACALRDSRALRSCEARTAKTDACPVQSVLDATLLSLRPAGWLTARARPARRISSNGCSIA